MSKDGSIAVGVNGLYKAFKLPHQKNTSVKSALINGLHLGKAKFEKQEVLRDVSFEIRKGEFFGITGRNGSGKSTLLKLLAGIYTPDKGSVRINGRLTPFIELGVGFNPELTGRENVFLNGALLGFNRKEMSAMYDDIVAFAELEKFMDQKLKNYSSGMQVRLAFSIAIRAESDILLIDEVLAVGDVNFQNKCIAVFEQIKRRGTTVVFVSHDMESVRRFCDRVILMENGKITKTGGAQEVIDEYLALNVTSAISKGTPFGMDDVVNKDEGKVKITRTVVRTQDGDILKNLKAEELYSVDVGLTFLADCADVMPGVVLRNQAGIRVTASNTEWAGHSPIKGRQGDNITVRFTFPNLLEHGTYYVSSNVVSSESRQFFDWDNDAVSFSMNAKPPTGGVVNPDYKVEVLPDEARL
jgi:ABC-2 type transport system ATP-binding protein